ncbi:MAG: HAD-IIIA family hydrolase [Hamadaea sp.]|nr:HAD-IIIA family hydrolase [Hamadaea sp.]
MSDGLFEAVLFDRDGTLIADRPYSGDPAGVTPMPGARAALDRLRANGLRLGVVTNQSAVGRGWLTRDQVDQVNRRVDELLGPFDTWQVCPHTPEDGCDCRKPRAGLVHAAADALGVPARRCVVVGDISSDMDAALAAGATPLLVPNQQTRVAEVIAAPSAVTDLETAADWILLRHRIVRPTAPLARPGNNVLVVRPDSLGDVVVTGPAVRAIAAHAGKVTVWCGPRGSAAARLLPGVDDVVEYATPWIDADPAPVSPAGLAEFAEDLARRDFDEALIFTSFHQSPLPTALVLRLAGVRRITAISHDYPGSLLDLRVRPPDDLPEPVRALAVAAAAGYRLPADDPGDLLVDLGRPVMRTSQIVVHPGGSAAARTCPPELMAEVVAALRAAGHPVLVTGGPGERELTAQVAVAGAVDLGGRTDVAGLTRLLAAAACVVTANTGPAHLAAATGTPVVSLFAPTVPFERWGPYHTPVVRLGDPAAACRDTRATECPLPGHPCLSSITPADVVAAVDRLVRRVA